MRPAVASDAKTFLDWSLATENNGFDPEIARSPSTITLCAYDTTGPLAFLPIQQPFMLESLAVRPDTPKSDVARVLKELTQAAVTQAHILSKNELYFLGTDSGTDAMASNQIFEKLNYTVYRVKLKDL